MSDEYRRHAAQRLCCLGQELTLITGTPTNPKTQTDGDFLAYDSQMASISHNSRDGISVQEVLDTSSLELELLAGAQGLERRVSWTHVSEVEDPWSWMDGGELLYTLGLGLPIEGEEQATYVRRLAENRIAALAIGVRHPPLQPEMLEVADRLGFPILFVPKGVPWLPIARMVAANSQNVAQHRLATHLRIFDMLLPRRPEPRTDAELFSALEEISGQRLYLISRHGTPALTGLEEPPDWVAGFLEPMAAGETSIPGGRIVPVAVGSRTPAYLVALEREDREPAGLSAIRNVATVAAVRLAECYREQELDRRRGSERLADLFSDRLSSAGAERILFEAGFDLSNPIVLAAARLRDDSDGNELRDRMREENVVHLMLEQRELYVLLPCTDTVLTMLSSDDDLTVGLSRPLNGRLTDFAVARREALWSLQRAREPGGPTVVRFGEGDDLAHWLPADFASLEQLVGRILGPIIEYDAERNTELLATLASSFRNQRKQMVTAEQLYLHKHTLAYRLSRVEELTGRRLSRVEDRAELWLALRAFAIVHPQRVNQDARLVV